MTNKTVLTEGKIARIGAQIDVCYEPSKFRAEFARAIEQAVLQSPEIQQLRNDAERLDSGCIMTAEFDELGMAYMLERRGIDLRAAIDAAMEVKP